MKERKTIVKYAPDLIPEWSDKNGELTPENVTIGSHKMVWWKGTCGHEWEAIIKNRFNGSGCPYCSGNAVLPGFNDAASAASWVSEEWSKKNGSLKPTDVTRQANRKVWWKGDCRHEWQARVADRVKKHTGCPYCTNEKFEIGVNDIFGMKPELAEEMICDYLGTANPRIYSPRSRAMVRWKCKECGCEWEAQINTRVNGGAGCPQCRRRRQAERAELKYRGDKLKVGFVRNILREAIRYYLKMAEVSFVVSDESIFGVPVEFYLPDNNGAIMIAEPLPSKIFQKALAAACWRNGTRLLYIVPYGERIYNNCHCITLTDNTPEVWTEAIQATMDLFGVDAEVDIQSDRKSIFKLYEEEDNGRNKTKVY